MSKLLKLVLISSLALTACSKKGKKSESYTPPAPPASSFRDGDEGDDGLRQRYERGEITQEEYIERRRERVERYDREHLEGGEDYREDGRIARRGGGGGVSGAPGGDVIDDLPPRQGPGAPGASSQAEQCGMAYQSEDPAWFPGLFRPVAQQPHFTGGVVADEKRDVRFTDASDDGLMEEMIARTERLPERLREGSDDLAWRIDNVKMFPDLRSGVVRMRFSYFSQKAKQPLSYDLEGRLSESRGQGVRAVLEQVSGRGTRFQAVVTCADPQSGCRNAMIRLEQFGVGERQDRVQRLAYILHRWGPANVLMAPQDRFQRDKIKNAGHFQLARLLANTAHNSCLVAVAEERAMRDRGQKGMHDCAFDRLVKECGKSPRPRQPALADVQVRTWAVAKGRAGFEVMMKQHTSQSLWDYQAPTTAALAFEGPLVFPRAKDLEIARTTYGRRIERAHLANNDGQGNLNLQIHFAGEPKSHMRLSITTMFNEGNSAEQASREFETTSDDAETGS